MTTGRLDTAAAPCLGVVGQRGRVRDYTRCPFCIQSIGSAGSIDARTTARRWGGDPICPSAEYSWFAEVGMEYMGFGVLLALWRYFFDVDWDVRVRRRKRRKNPRG